MAEECIAAGVNYVDLADGREFVCEIDELDDDAKKNVLFLLHAPPHLLLSLSHPAYCAFLIKLLFLTLILECSCD